MSNQANLLRDIDVAQSMEIATFAAAGSTQSDATLLTTRRCNVTGADGTKGVKLPSAIKGMSVGIYNADADDLLIYPNTGDDINDGTVNTSITISGYSKAVFEAFDNSTWTIDRGGIESGTTQFENINVSGNAQLSSAVVTAVMSQPELSLVAAGAGTLAALGTNQATAAAISKTVTYVTGSDGTVGVVLPAAGASTKQSAYLIYNTVASQLLKVYPATGDDINDGSTNAAILIPGKSAGLLWATDDTTWAYVGIKQSAALTAALTTITPADAEGTPDYAIAAITQTTPYGFASAQEAITVLYVLKNLQTRVNEIASALGLN